MSINEHLKYLRECANELQNSEEFRGLAVIMLAVALERQVKKVVIYNYRKSGLSARFVRNHLLDNLSYSMLIHEYNWSQPDKRKLVEIWKKRKHRVSDLTGVMKIRNKIIHSTSGVSEQAIKNSIEDLLFVIENLSTIFTEEVGYNGIEPLPTNFSISRTDISNKIHSRSVVLKFNKK